jgi:hypothetical protein
MRYGAALTADLNSKAVKHLIRFDGQEDLCFALWSPSWGKTRHSALIYKLILPHSGERKVHGNATFTAAYFQRALGEAMKERAGLAFMHSHPSYGWQGMSQDDIQAEKGHAAATKGATELPLVGLTIAQDGSWSARFWEKTAPRQYDCMWCENVRIVGHALKSTFNNALLPVPRFRRNLRRTLSAWGPEVQASLARLTIGIIGTGSVGSIVAEALARMGIKNLKLIDFDTIETVNLDRLLHASEKDAKKKRAKVAVLAKALHVSATADEFSVDPIEWSVVEEQGFRHALDCDILFSCVDRPWPRSVLNFIAYAHLIPVVDGGIKVVRKPNGLLRGADWKAHIVGPERICLECLGQYDPGLVQAEREGSFDDPHYIESLPTDHIARVNENVFGFSLSVASLQVLQMLSMVIAPSNMPYVGEQNYHFVTGNMDVSSSDCKAPCIFQSITALGERAGLCVTGKHIEAEKQRKIRKDYQPLWKKLLNRKS